MDKMIIGILASLLLAVSFSAPAWAGVPGSLSVTLISSQGSVMELGQANPLTASISGGDGNYVCSWSYTTPFPVSQYTFGGQSCNATFRANSTNVGSSDVVSVGVADGSGNTGSAFTYIAVKPVHVLEFSIAPSASTVYVGNSVSISNSTLNSTTNSPTGAAPYQFSYSIPTSVAPGNNNDFTFTIPGVFEITEYAVDGYGVSASASVYITALPLLQPLSATVFTPESTIVAGQSGAPVSVQPVGGLPPYTYEWFVNGVQNTTSTSNTFAFNPVTPSTYNVYVVISDTNGNTTQSSNIIINLVAPLAAVLHPSTSLISAGQSVTFTNSTTGGMVPYIYSYTENNPTGVVQSGNTLTFNNAGNYLVTFTVSDMIGETATSQSLITVTPPLVITSFTANANMVTANSVVKFSNTTTGGTGKNVYYYTVNAPSGYSINGNSILFSAVGNYPVTLHVSDISGETSQATQLITVTTPPVMGCTGLNKGSVISITGSYITKTVVITNQSAVQITGSYDNIAVKMPGSNCNIAVRVTGSSDTVSVYNGTITLTETGSYDITNLYGTVISAQTTTGSYDKILGAIINGNAYTITGSSNLVESVQVMNLTSLTLTGSYVDLTMNMLTTKPMAITLTGSYDTIHTSKGAVSLRITGSMNNFYYHDTTITSQTITGTGNKITKY